MISIVIVIDIDDTTEPVGFGFGESQEEALNRAWDDVNCTSQAKIEEYGFRIVRW